MHVTPIKILDFRDAQGGLVCRGIRKNKVVFIELQSAR